MSIHTGFTLQAGSEIVLLTNDNITFRDVEVSSDGAGSLTIGGVVKPTRIAITVALGGNVNGLTITNSDNTNDPHAAIITQDASDGAGLHVKNAGNFAYIPAAVTTGLVKIEMINAADEGTALVVWNKGIGRGFKVITDEAASIGAEILDNSAGTNVQTLLVNARTSVNGSNYFYRNLASANTAGALVNIVNDNSGDDQATLNVQQDSPADALVVDMNGNANGIFVDHDDTGTAGSIEVDRDGNNGAKIAGIVLTVDNGGAGGVMGIDMSAFTAGEALIKAPADATVITTSTVDSEGRLSVDIGGTIKYVPYFT